jgi:hypothetical protein
MSSHFWCVLWNWIIYNFSTMVLMATILMTIYYPLCEKGSCRFYLFAWLIIKGASSTAKLMSIVLECYSDKFVKKTKYFLTLENDSKNGLKNFSYYFDALFCMKAIEKVLASVNTCMRKINNLFRRAFYIFHFTWLWIWYFSKGFNSSVPWRNLRTFPIAIQHHRWSMKNL